MLKRIQELTTHPAVLAVPFSIVIILLLPPVFQKYVLNNISSGFELAHKIVSYCDLNSDGISEKIIYNTPEDINPFFTVYSENKIIDQWNFKGRFLPAQNYRYCDIDDDGLKEIFVLTRDNDSIFFYVIKPFVKNQSWYSKQFIYKLENTPESYMPGVYFSDFPDTDKDGFKEVVIAINAGSTLKPRNLFKINIAAGTVIMSPLSGTGVLYPEAFDINGDGFNEYMGFTAAFGNYHTDIPYKDDRAWLIVLDKDMNFLFEPKGFGGYITTLHTVPFVSDKKNRLIALQNYKGTGEVKRRLMKFDISGNLLKERGLTGIEKHGDCYLLSPNIHRREHLFLILENGLAEEIDSNLNVVRSIEIPGIAYRKPVRLDLDLDGKDEFIFYRADMQGIIITRNDFSHPVEMSLANDSLNGIAVSVIKRGKEGPLLFMKCGVHTHLLGYFANPLFYFKYISWIAIYLLVFLILYVLQIIQRKRAERKYETEKKIARLQLSAIKAQTDPHFTLNLINSIGALFYKKDSETAGYIFGKYAKLLRSTIIGSENISTTLKDELEYVENYLDLEKFRYDYKFDYSINIKTGVNTSVEIPKMLVHTFVENAIKHGIKHLEGEGFLNINVANEGKSIVISVADNGIGRQKAKEYSKLSTGKGLKILDNILELYLKMKNRKISYTVDDNIINGKAQGTKVIITVPGETKKDKT